MIKEKNKDNINPLIEFYKIERNIIINHGKALKSLYSKEKKN